MPRRCRPIIIDGKQVGIATVQVGYCQTTGCYGVEEKLCDYPVTRKGKPGTCDRKLCSRCAVNVGPNKDYCPPHARVAK
jgi:hypothetical protein